MGSRASQIIETIDQVITDGVTRGLGHLSLRDTPLDGRTISLGERDVLSFGTCSYLGLDRHPAIIDAIAEGAERFGSQFSCSRVYLSLGLYDELEALLAEIFGQPTLVAPSTSLGHFAALPVVVGDGDVVVLDQQVHSSVQTAAQLLRARGIPIHIVRHNRLDQLEAKLARLRGHDRIWYLADGVYSMFGDGAPVSALREMLDRWPKLWLYVDDAHGFGWDGRHGCGFVRARIDHHPRMVLAVSLNKSFAAAGGALVFPDDEMRRRVRTCGSTLIFSGPIQPPMLAGAVASARLHLSDAHAAMQDELRERIRYCDEGLTRRGIPQVLADDTPLFFVPTGLPRLVYEIVGRLLDDGYSVNVGCFPAVPMTNGGVRFHVHRHLRFEDIDGLLDRLALHWRTVLSEANVTPQTLARAFRKPELADTIDLSPPRAAARPTAAPLSLHRVDTIADVDPAMWDACFAGRGPMTHAALSVIEPAFGRSSDPNIRAKFHYAWVLDERDAVVAATFFTEAMVKDELLASPEISMRVAARRLAEGPDFLVSRAIGTGCPLTLGEHIFLDRQHPRWRDALARLVDALRSTKEDTDADRILLRDFAGAPAAEMAADSELRDVMLDLGFVEVAMPDMMTIESVDWTDRDGLLRGLGSRYRYDVRREILPHLDRIRVESGPADVDTIEFEYALFRSVHARSWELSTFPLPLALFHALHRSPCFDVLRFYRTDGTPRQMQMPVGVMLSHFEGGRYTALVVGLEQALIGTHALYKQTLLRTVERAQQLGATSINLAFTADLVKKKVGARPRPTSAFLLLDDTFGGGVLETV